MCYIKREPETMNKKADFRWLNEIFPNILNIDKITMTKHIHNPSDTRRNLWSLAEILMKATFSYCTYQIFPPIVHHLGNLYLQCLVRLRMLATSRI